MNALASEKQFVDQISGLLNEGAENLGSQTGRQLEHIRLSALRSAETPARSFIPGRWIIFGSFATAATAAVALFFWLQTSPGNLPLRNIEDFEIITSSERVDFYEDLDFYRWLAAKENGRDRKKFRGV